MLKRSLITFSLLMWATASLALTPVPGFKATDTVANITVFKMDGKDIEISSTASDFKYEDLTQKELEEVKKLMTAKQEYGKMFGFAEWKSSGMKLIEQNGERIVLIQGTYKDEVKKTVNFLEVYWATRQKAGQYLITSDSIALKMDQFSEYLK